MTLRELRVDTAGVAGQGKEMSTAAGEIPETPTGDVAGGEDALSAAYAAHAAMTIDPAVASRPKTTKLASGYAKAVQAAAGIYAGDDEQVAGTVARQMPGTGDTATRGAGGEARPPGQAGYFSSLMGPVLQPPAAQTEQAPMRTGGGLSGMPHVVTDGPQGGMPQSGQIGGSSQAGLGRAFPQGFSSSAANAAAGAGAGQPGAARLPDSVVRPQPGAAPGDASVGDWPETEPGSGR
jgi:hypothetical protein